MGAGSDFQIGLLHNVLGIAGVFDNRQDIAVEGTLRQTVELFQRVPVIPSDAGNQVLINFGPDPFLAQRLSYRHHKK